MPISFPTSPANGDTHVIGSITYQYDSTDDKWTGLGVTPTDKLIEGSNTVDLNGNSLEIGGTPPWSVTGGDYNNLSIRGGTASSSGFMWLGNGTATNNGDFDLGRINFLNGPTIVAQIKGTTETSANDDGRISFLTKSTGNNIVERVRIDSDGTVDINKPTAAGLVVGGNGGGGDYHIEIGQLGTNGSGGINATGTSTSLKFQLNGSDIARFDSSGRLLVGNATATINEAKIEAYADNTGNADVLCLYNKDTATGNTANILFAPSNQVAGARIICEAMEDFSTSANRTADLAFVTRQDGTLGEAMRIAGDGDVRIGDYNTVNKNVGLSINKSDSRLLEMRVGNGTDTNFVKRYGFAFVRSTSEGTFNLVSLGSVSGNSHVVIEIKMYVVSATNDQAAIITAYAHARQQSPATSYTYNTQTPTVQFIVGTGIAAGSLQWTGGVLQYNSDANNNYTKYNTEITVWAHDRMDIGFS